MQVWIASYPRSGNTFLRILLRHRYAIRSICSEFQRTGPAPRMFARSRVLTPDYASDEDPVVPNVLGVKTHGLPENTTDRAVYVVRDGRDSLVSYAFFALTLERKCLPEDLSRPEVAETVRQFILAPRPGYGTWSENVDSWVDRPNTIVVRYESLIAQPGPVVDGIVGTLGIDAPVVAESIPTFQELKSGSGKFFRKGIAGSWREVFTPELHDLFWKHNGATMTRLGYLRESPLKASA